MTALSHLVPIIMPYICCFFFPSGFDGNISIKLKKTVLFLYGKCVVEFHFYQQFEMRYKPVLNITRKSLNIMKVFKSYIISISELRRL